MTTLRRSLLSRLRWTWAIALPTAWFSAIFLSQRLATVAACLVAIALALIVRVWCLPMATLSASECTFSAALPLLTKRKTVPLPIEAGFAYCNYGPLRGTLPVFLVDGRPIAVYSCIGFNNETVKLLEQLGLRSVRVYYASTLRGAMKQWLAEDGMRQNL